ncbi:MAG: hypothetical protein KGJ86_14745, partial [Chloroflexota bacterium]|nr:hypothetical protein [Chloroflexota bacterium]
MLRTIRDFHYARETVFPRPEFRSQLERQITDQLTGQRAPVRNGRASRWSMFARWWQFAAAAAAFVAVLVSTAWISPQARAQVGRIVCYIPGLGIRSCDTTGLVMAAPVSVTKGDQTLTIDDLLSSGGQTLVSLNVTVDPTVYDTLDKVGQLGPAVKLALTDSTGKQYGQVWAFNPYGADIRQLPTPKSTLVLHEVPFAPLDPSVRAVDIQVTGPAAVGTWVVHVSVEPPASRTVPVGRAGGSSATVQGITIT